MKKFLFTAIIFLMCACTSSGPRSALDSLADALSTNNPQQFLAGFDMTAYANNEIRNLTETDTALNFINSMGRMLGIGSVDDLLNSFVDIKAGLEDRFVREVASGELMAQCREATTPDCPWVPQSLRSAQIVEIGAEGAIAKVTTPALLTSWLCLRKINNKWLVIGQAVLESRARAIVASAIGKSGNGQPAAPASKPGSVQDAVKI